MKSRLIQLGEVVPLTKAQTVMGGIATAAFFCPELGIVPRAFGNLALAYGLNPAPVSVVSAGVALSLAPYLAGSYARFIKPSVRAKYRGLRLGPIRATERDLFTSMLVLGSTGSGKTSRVLFPAIEDSLNTYNVEDPDVFSTNPLQKLGGFVLEAKGKFFETIVLLAHNAGRNSSTDVRVIRAGSTLPVCEFRDENGRRFFLNAQPCSSGSEVARFFQKHKFKDKSSIQSDLFKRVKEKDRIFRESELREMEVPVTKDVRFIGWRWQGDKLRRVLHTPKRDEPVFSDELIEAPKKLKYSRTVFWSNGLQYNLIDQNIPASEAAARIAMVAKMVTGEGKGGGDNQYFYTAAQRVIQAAIRLQRIIEPDKQVTVIDINRIIAQPTATKAALKRLGEFKRFHQEKKIACEKAGDPEQANEHDKVARSYEDLDKWFTEEWEKQTTQGTTGTAIISTISNLFGPFMNEPTLQETFCNPATFSFNDCMQKGTIYAFVPGPEFENNARMIGTVLKMDWQSRMLQRVSEGSEWINKNRLVIHVNDECQGYIIAGQQDSGDPKFYSLCRESRVQNYCATQSEAWVYTAVSNNEARVWLQSFGTRVWLTQTDTETNKRAAELSGQIKKEDRSYTEQLSVGDMLSGKEANAKQKVGYKDKQRFEPHEFSELKEDEVICFNKGEGMQELRMGDCKAAKGKIPYRWITSPQGAELIADRMRWWFVETWENQLFEVKKTALLDLVASNTTTAAPAPATAATGSVPPTPTPATPEPPKPVSTTPPAQPAPPPPGGAVDATKTPPAKTKDSSGSSGSAPKMRPPAAAPTPAPQAAPEALDSALRQADTLPLAHEPEPMAPPEIASSSESSAPQPSPVQPEAQPTSDETITPEEIQRQSAAYEELLENNPFALVDYRDIFGLDAGLAGARQKWARDTSGDAKLVGQDGAFGGDKTVLEDVAKRERPSDEFRAPLDFTEPAPVDPTQELLRRTVSRNPGNAGAPPEVRRRSKWEDL